MRFAGVGVCNTAIDWGLFLLLHGHLGITLANFVSASAGMAFSFVVNGLFTFRAGRLTLRQGLLFVATTGTVMWVAQPLLIHGWLWVLEHLLDDADLRLAAAKLASIACSLALNFAAYRLVVWPVTRQAEPAPR
ncbi:GtrA family protein [Nocardioides antri]|uniref:GtrA family protein n=1 Tax=Nocardioides antri TaxID=2607659 RepID=UPI00165F58BA|nr:GtrA family protein [Nocardioides antri]